MSMTPHQQPEGDQIDPDQEREPGATDADADGAQQETGDANSGAGTSEGTDAKQSADAAFESFQASDNPENEATPEPKADEPKAAESEKPTKSESEDEDEAELKLTEAEQQARHVPAKKFQRLLKSRIKTREELKQERAIVDGVVSKFSHAGIQAHEISATLDQLAAAKRGDANAIAAVKQRLGIREEPKQTGYTEEQVAEAIREAVENIDVDAGLAVLRKGKKPAQEQRQQEVATHQPQQQQPSFEDQARQAVAPIANAIRTKYGADAGKVGEFIEREAQMRLSEMQEAGAQINATVLTNVYRRAWGSVEERLKAQKATKPPASVRSSTSSAPVKPKSADEQFEAFQRT